VIAVDATQRVRPAAVQELLHAVRDGSALAMADCSCADDALAAQALGFDLIGTTLSGYVGPGPVPPGPDLELVRQLVGVGLRVMAEGRFNTPEQAREALQAGAWAVTVGSAITRPEWVTGWFVQALSGRQARG
jgi:N-acylglucosamine-6-phosphate 2-epimerase